ncbi:MAG: S9 family peptidase [Deferribacteres bacterium]|nr:S9 family peptidase [candidate division KSB1 bacterium]MCB9500883.1 S9 family peptidase [Deferribacteres bacterium]
MKKDIKPPVAEKIPQELTIHNDTRIDDYFWLSDRDNPKVIDYLEAENAYTETMLGHTKKLQEKLYDEIVGRIKQTDESVPYRKNGFYYYNRYEDGKEYPIYCRKQGTMEAEEQIMLDVNEMAQGHDYIAVSGRNVSQNNKLVAFGVDTVSRRRYTIHFKNLETGEILADRIPNTTGSVAWANDNVTVFYTLKDTVTLRSYKIMKHKLGTSAEDDRMVFHEADDTFDAHVWKSKSGRYIMIGSFQTLSTEYRFVDADHPENDFKLIQPRERDLEYHAMDFGDQFYIRTNREAKNFKLVKTPIKTPRKEYWQDIIPHRADVLLENVEIFKNYLVTKERKNGLPELRIIKWQDWSEHYLDFGEATYTANISTNPEFDTDILRYSYSSLTTPNSTFDYDMASREKTLMKQQEVVGDFSADNYISERLYAKSRDGVEVPISLVYRKDRKKDTGNPLLLYGYGSYGYSVEPYFNSVRLSLLDRGFIYAMAHVRGGEEMGRQWYEDGKLLKKKNTFNDFIDCAQHLILFGYTNTDMLFAQGGSAGGLLMGAVVNMRPDLWKGVIAAVPWVDVVTTMLDDTIPLTTSEYDEWGNPNNKEYYDYMLSYSPYDNVEAKDYPAMLVTTGLHDSQVQYFEPTKWVAKLRAMKTDNNVLVLDCDMGSGHGGASGRFKRYKRTALEYAFMFDLLGIKQ